MKLLYNTNNNIISLSATSGISNSFSGNYNRDVLNRYSSKDIFDFDTVVRSSKDALKLEELRDSRAKIRKCAI